MSQNCSVKKCTRTSRGLCDCCQQELCLQHLTEHNALLISQLNPLTDEINALGDRLKTLDIQKTIDNSRQKLEQWRQDCYKKIDNVFEQKCQEFAQLINNRVSQQRDELNRIYLKMSELINTQETTRQEIDALTSTIRQLEENMNNIDQACSVINTGPLIIDDTSILIEKITEHELDLSTLSPVYKTIHRPKGSFRPFTGNERYLLIHQQPNICFFDREMNIAKQIVWPYGTIQDMCWSSALNGLIVLGKHNIFLINENTMSIDNLHINEQRCWLSCTCSDTVLFASTNEDASSIVEFTLAPAIKFSREWKYPLTCAKDEIIDSIIYNNGNLALMVRNTFDKSLRIDLRYAKTFDRIWSLQLDIRWVQNFAFRCCSLTSNEWLIADYETGQLLQITKDGKIKKTIKYHPTPRRAILFNMNKLVVLTVDGVNMHTIQ